MDSQTFYTFPEIYKSWYLEEHPDARSVIHKNEDFPGLSDARNLFQSFLLRLDMLGALSRNENGRFAFNEDGKKLLRMFLSRSKEKAFKNIRRGKFVPEDASLYDEILALIVSNMRALGYSQCKIDQWAICFWHAVTESANHPEDFLTGLKTVYPSGEVQEILSGYESPASYYEVLYYVSERAKKSFFQFQQRWRQLIRLTLELRQNEVDAIHAKSGGVSDSDVAILSGFLDSLPKCPDILYSDDTHLATNRLRLKAEKEYVKKAEKFFTKGRTTKMANKLQPVYDKSPKSSKPWELYFQAVLRLSELSEPRKIRAHRIIRHRRKNCKVGKRGGNR